MMTEWHPVLVEGDQADEDEEVEVRLDRSARQVDQHGRTEHQARGDEERRQTAIARHPREDEAERGDRDLEGGMAHAVALPNAEGEQRRQMQPQDPADQQVAPAERLCVERVAPGEVVEHGAAERTPPAAVLGQRRPEMHGRAPGVAAVIASVGVGGTSSTRTIGMTAPSCWTSRIAPDPILHRVPILNTTGGRNIHP